MLGLITNRTQSNVNRRNELSAKGWNNMTTDERTEWSGNPLEHTEVNLLPYGPNYSGSVNLTYTSDAITATTTGEGTYLYSISIIGDAVDYENKTFTLSVANMEATNGATPKLTLYWYNSENDTAYIDEMIALGSKEIALGSSGGKQKLALYVYATTGVSVGVGTTARFEKVMFENGNTAHEYRPYAEIVPTNCTKGAYNYSDLNRVERAVAEISNLGGLDLVTKTDWGMWDVPTVSEMDRYLGNIKILRDLYVIDIDVPTNMNNLTYVGANNIEKILQEAHLFAIEQGGVTS